MKTKAYALISLTAGAVIILLVLLWQVQNPRAASVNSETVPSRGAEVVGKTLLGSVPFDAAHLDSTDAGLYEASNSVIDKEGSQPLEGEGRNSLLEELATLALTDGQGALDRLFEGNDEGVRREFFPLLLDVWADVAPEEALMWYHDSAQDALAGDGYKPGPSFYSKAFRHLAERNPQRAAQSFPVVEGAEERLSALSGMVDVAIETGQLPELMGVLGPHAELRPVEVAFMSSVVGDEDSFAAIQAELPSRERKILGLFVSENVPADNAIP